MTPALRTVFEEFARNGRWGTCAACPRDVDGKAHPEFCPYTDRYDHQLTFRNLVRAYELETKEQV